MTAAKPRTSAQLLTIAQAAERLGCSESHVYRLIASGALPVADISTPGSRQPKSRVPEDDLAAYVAGLVRTAGRLRLAT